MDNVIPFARPLRDDGPRHAAFASGEADPNRLAADLGDAEEWLETAIIHLKVASCSPSPDGAVVSQAALNLVLGHMERLEIRLGLIPPAGGAA